MKIYKQNFENKISTVKIGKKNIVNIGGDLNLPFYDEENFNPNISIAFEILDKIPIDRIEWSEDDFKNVWNNTGDWALKCKNDFGAKIICLYLLSSLTLRKIAKIRFLRIAPIVKIVTITKYLKIA